MHEMSIVTGMLAIVREEMAKHNVSRLVLVRMCYGPLANIVPDALEFSFEALTAGTDLEGARLEIEALPVELRCSRCDTVFRPEGGSRFAPCPSCGMETGHKVESGLELYVQHIEAE